MNTYRQIFDLAHRVVVIFGACGTIGSEVSLAVSCFGARIICCDLDMEKVNSLVEEINSSFDCERAVSKTIDVRNPGEIKALFQQIQESEGRIDGVVNLAYPRDEKYGAGFLDVEPDHFDNNVAWNLRSAFFIAQEAARIMIEQHSGCIVNFGSIYGVVGPTFEIYNDTPMTMPVEYSLIKGGIINFTRYLASFLAPYGVRANCISPGGVYNNQPEPFVSQYSKKTPMGRMAEPADIPGSVIYLLSEASQYVTGQNILVDGGWTSC